MVCLGLVGEGIAIQNKQIIDGSAVSTDCHYYAYLDGYKIIFNGEIILIYRCISKLERRPSMLFAIWRMEGCEHKECWWNLSILAIFVR